MHTGFEAGIGDIAKVLDIAVFFDFFDDLSVAEVSQSGDEGGCHDGAQGLSGSSFLSVVEGDEAIDDGLPRDDVAQENQFVCGIRQMGLNPLGTEGILKGLCYHDLDLFEGVR